MRTSANRMLGITVGVIAVIAIAVGVFTATQSPSALDPDSPEGVVQQYMTAVLEHRNDDAATFLDATGKCTADDLDRYGTQQDARVDLTSSETTGATARVTVSIEYSSGDPFGGGWSEEKTMRLAKTGSSWTITGIPWPLYECGMTVVK